MSERSLHLSIFIFLIAILWSLCSGTARASYLSINVRDDRVHLRAEEVPLIDVVTGVCERTGIILKSGDPMTEPVSLELKGLSLEKCLRRLLNRRNYALIFEGKADDQFVLVSLRILGAGSVVTVEPEAPALRPDDPIKRYEKKSFVRMFGDSKNLSNSVSADEVKSSPVPDDIGGIRLTRIPEESVLAQIGVEVGDIVRGVNGQPVKSTDDLLECLKNPPLGLPTIRIERLKSDGLIDPIYIELH